MQTGIYFAQLAVKRSLRSRRATLKLDSVWDRIEIELLAAELDAALPRRK